MDIYAKAVDELQRVEAELTALDKLQKRRDELRQFIQIAKTLLPAPRSLMEAAQASALPSGDEIAARRDTAKNRIITGAVRFIAEHGPLQTAALIEHLERDGVVIGGSDKVLSVSSILSREKSTFRSDRAAGGWSLITPHKENPPQGLDAPAGDDVGSEFA